MTKIKKDCIKREAIGIIDVKLTGEIYNRRYAMKDIEMVVDLVNDMFQNEIKIKIVNANIKEKV